MLNRLSLVEMAEGVRTGRFTARALVEAHLEAIRGTGRRLNAFVEVYEEEALRAAEGCCRRGRCEGYR
jgi:Asp-tRNA(Asn)/Glu-tRNA(Gln) amidotransferase A subunit family amidase